MLNFGHWRRICRSGICRHRQLRRQQRDSLVWLTSPALAVNVNNAYSGPSLALVLSVFFGLPATLWAYKCLMLVVFQRHVIYMPYLPPNSRTETLSSLPASSRELRRLNVSEITVQSEGRIRLSGLAVRANNATPDVRRVIVYLQGNAGSPIHRLPVFQALLDSSPTSRLRNTTLILAVAPRNYYTSTRQRITQRGILHDYSCVLEYTLQKYPEAQITLYGHSIGATIALCLLSDANGGDSADWQRVRGAVLENPFTSCPDMLLALYPNKWLPYRRLGRFILDKWDARQAISQSATDGDKSLLSTLLPNLCFLISEHDEIVPPQMGEELYRLSQSTKQVGSRGKLVTIDSALHENGFTKRKWQQEFWKYLVEIT